MHSFKLFVTREQIQAHLITAAAVTETMTPVVFPLFPKLPTIPRSRKSLKCYTADNSTLSDD